MIMGKFCSDGLDAQILPLTLPFAALFERESEVIYPIRVRLKDLQFALHQSERSRRSHFLSPASAKRF